MPGPYHNIVFPLFGKQIGGVAAGLVRGIGYSASEVAAARKKAALAFNDESLPLLATAYLSSCSEALGISEREAEKVFSDD